METGEYSNISELVGERKGKASSSSSSSSLEFSRRHLTHSAFAKVVTHNDDDDGDDVDYECYSDNGDYEELPDDLPVMCPSKSQNRENVAAKSSSSISSISNWGGSGRCSDDRIDSAKILDMKTKLRPTVTKVQESRNNNSNNNSSNNNKSTGGDNEVSALKPLTKGNRLRQNNTNAVKAQTPSAVEVGSGVESVKIAALKSRLRPVLSRQDNNDRPADNNDKESVDGRHFNERSLPVATPSTTPKFNPPHHHQSPIGNETSSDARPQTTPSKASSARKFFKSPSCDDDDDDDHREARRDAAQPLRSDANAATAAAVSAASSKSKPFFAQPSPQAPKTSAARSASVTPARNAVDTDDGFESPSQQRFMRKGASLGRSDDNNRFNNNLNTRQENDSTLASQKWYFGGIGREISEEMLGRMFNENGSYVVRDCYNGGRDSPYALSVVHNKRIYHMIIRRRSDDNKFSLGRPKSDEKVFNSVMEMITFHQNNPIELIDESNKDPSKRTISGRVTLKKCPSKDQ